MPHAAGRLHASRPGLPETPNLQLLCHPSCFCRHIDDRPWEGYAFGDELDLATSPRDVVHARRKQTP